MSAALVVRVVLVLMCVALPVSTFAQEGSERLLTAERQWEQKVGLDQRIIGGQPVSITDNPWQVAILAATVPTNLVAQFCGGSVIAPRWVLTAAHCVDRQTPPERIHVLTGTDSLEQGGSRIQATRIHVHENWKPETTGFDFDIALIEVESDLGGTAVVGDTSTTEHPITLAVRVTGWGRTSRSSQVGSKMLQGIEIPYVTRATCNRPLSYNGQVTTNMICAGPQQGGVDSCQGDSGGPATAMINETRRQVGIVSWGTGCAVANKYGIYTNLSQFGAWVTEKTGGAVKW